MGFSANFVQAQIRSSGGRDVLFIDGQSMVKKVPKEPEPFRSQKLEDVEKMYVAVHDPHAAAGNGHRLQILGAEVTRVKGSADWSVEIARTQDTDPPLPAAGAEIILIGTTVLKAGGPFCWSEPQKVKPKT